MPGSERPIIPVMGRAGAGGAIDVAFEQAPAEGFDQIALGSAADLIGFRVDGQSMAPRFRDGDIILCAREQPGAVADFIGREAVVRTEEMDGGGRRFIKRIAHGPRRGLYNLESIGQDLAPIVGIRIARASPVKLVVPRGRG